MAFLRPLKEPGFVLLTLAGFFAYGKSQSGVGGVKTKLSMAGVHICTLYLRFRQSRIARDVATVGKLPRAYPQSAFVALSVPPISGRIVGDSGGLFKYAAVFVGFSSVVDTMVIPATHINLGGLKPVKF